MQKERSHQINSLPWPFPSPQTPRATHGAICHTSPSDHGVVFTQWPNLLPPSISIWNLLPFVMFSSRRGWQSFLKASCADPLGMLTTFEQGAPMLHFEVIPPLMSLTSDEKHCGNKVSFHMDRSSMKMESKCFSWSLVAKWPQKEWYLFWEKNLRLWLSDLHKGKGGKPKTSRPSAARNTSLINMNDN